MLLLLRSNKFIICVAWVIFKYKTIAEKILQFWDQKFSNKVDTNIIQLFNIESKTMNLPYSWKWSINEIKARININP